jgi:flagellar hook-associated protein 2
MINLNLSATSADSGSGIDVTAIVNQILDSKRGPEKLWQTQQDSLTQQNSTWTTIQSALSTLSSTSTNLGDIVGGINAKTAVSSQSSILTATAQTSATSGNHVIVVNNLANTSSAYSDVITTSTIAPGSITLKIGTGASQVIPVDDTDKTTTLSGLANYINSHSMGVSASVINDAAGSRLALLSQTTGQPGDISVSSDIGGMNFHKTAGQNASLTIDGVPISSSGNTVTGVIAGVTLNLVDAAPTTEVQLNVGPDISGAKQSVNNFVAAYNSVIQAINAQFVYNPDTATAGPLATDSTLRSLQASLLSQASYTKKDNTGIASLATLGVSMNNDGTLTVDDSKLSDVLNSDYTSFVELMQGTDLVTGGFAKQFSAELNRYTAVSTGVISLDLQQISNTQDLLSQQISDLEDRLALEQVQLTAQYSKVDAALRQYPLIMSQITSELSVFSQMKG